MHEIELKFVIPPTKVNAVKAQTQVKTSQQHQLDAYYFDTPDQLLGQAGIALRIRNENGNWVQTIKAKADGIAKRLEENIALDLPARIAASKLLPDLSKHSETLRRLLNDVLPIDELNTALTLKFATKVNRITREIKRYGNIVEVAFDEGKIISGRKSTPICEVEFELLQGDIGFLIDTAKSWVKRHRLSYSTVSKAEAGSRLFSGITSGPVVKSDLKGFQKDDRIHAKTTADDFLRAVVQNCLVQILPNVSDIAASKLHSSDAPLDGNHVHQARVGMRRLRTALKSFAHFAPATVTPETLTLWQNQLKTTFTHLGSYRDLEILQTKTQPFLETQGAPVMTWSLELTVEPSDAVKDTAFQLTLLDLIAFAAGATPSTSGQTSQHEQHNTTQASDIAKPILTKMIDKLFNKIARDSERFAMLENEQQHDVRKRLKKLRYISEFAAPLYRLKTSSKKTKKAQKASSTKQNQIQSNQSVKPSQFLAYLEPAQDVLGEFNDAAVGHAAYAQLTASEPKAWFAVGYFTASEMSAAKDCAVALKTVKDAPKFW